MKRLSNFYSKYPELFAVFILLVMSFPFKFPFQADDYVFLRRSLEPGLYDFLGYAEQMTRNPMLYLMMIPTFKSGLFDFGFFPMYFYFALYVIGLGFALRGLVRDSAGELREKPVWLFACLSFLPLLALNPNQGEVFYFPICMPYSVGALCLGLMCWIRPWVAKLVFMLIAFATLETFIFPALALLFLPSLVTLDSKSMKASLFNISVKPLLLWVCAIALTIANRKLLSLFFPSFHYTLAINPIAMIGQIPSIATMLWGSFFYKMNWVATFINLVAYSLLLYSCLSTKSISIRSLGLLGLVVIFCDIHILVMSYSAMRAHFGAIFVQSAIVSLLMSLMFFSEKRRFIRNSVIGLIIASFTIQNLRIFNTKDHNYHELQRLAAEAIGKMDSCENPCIVEMPRLDRNMKWDWVMPEIFWEAYLEYIKAKNRPNLNVKFVFQK